VLYAASVPFDGLSLGGRSLPFVVGSLYLVAAVLRRVTHGRHAAGGQAPTRHAWPAALFTFYCLASYYWSIDPAVTLSRTATLLVLLVTSWFLAQDLAGVARQVPLALVLGALPAAVLVLSSPASITDRRTANGNANDVALTLLLAVACVVWVALRSRGQTRALGIVALPILVAAIVATGSRTAVLGGLAMVLAGVAWLAWHRQWRPFLVLGTLCLIGWAALTSLPAGMVPARLGTIQDALSSGTLSDRTIFWNAILDRGFGLTGIGPGATSDFLTGAVGSASVAHNTFLEVFLETGILGGLIFVAMLLGAAISARRSPYLELVVLMLPVMLAGTMTLSIEGSRPLWFVLALAWAARTGKPGAHAPTPRRSVRAAPIPAR
jgi:O-antigen ligase